MSLPSHCQATVLVLVWALLSVGSPRLHAANPPPPNTLADITTASFAGLEIGMDVMAANAALQGEGYRWEGKPVRGVGREVKLQTEFAPSVAGTPCTHRYQRVQGKETRTASFSCDLATMRLISFSFRVQVAGTGTTGTPALESSPHFSDTQPWMKKFCGEGWRKNVMPTVAWRYTPPENATGSSHVCQGGTRDASVKTQRYVDGKVYSFALTSLVRPDMADFSVNVGVGPAQ